MAEDPEATGLVPVVPIRRYYAFFWIGGDPPTPTPAAPPQDCPCGSRSWASLTASDGEVRHTAKCNVCGHERDVYYDPFTGSTGATAAPVSPWETSNTAEADLRWYYSESDGELGAHSSWESKVQLAHFGNDTGPAIETIMGEATAATPSDQKIWAAKRWARIRTALQRLERRHQAILEACFMLRRPNVQIAGYVGSENEPVVSYLVASGEMTMKRLEQKKERESVKNDAAAIRIGALTAYADARAMGFAIEPFLRRNREKQQASSRGAGKRRLVPKVAPISPWTAPVEA